MYAVCNDDTVARKRGTRSAANHAWRRPRVSWLIAQQASTSSFPLARRWNWRQLHESLQPHTTLASDWVPKGLCGGDR